MWEYGSVGEETIWIILTPSCVVAPLSSRLPTAEPCLSTSQATSPAHRVVLQRIRELPGMAVGSSPGLVEASDGLAQGLDLPLDALQGLHAGLELA